MDTGTIILWLGVLAILAYVVIQHRKKNPANGAEWQLLYSAGAVLTKTLTWWKVVGPKVGHLNYLPWYKPFKLSPGQTIVARLKVVGGYQPVDGNPGAKPTVAIMLNRKGDKPNGAVNNEGGPGEYNTYRLFSRQRAVLEEGIVVLNVKLDTSGLGPVVQGHLTEEDVANTLRELESLNFVFGGGTGAGHGVVETTPSSIELLELYVI